METGQRQYRLPHRGRASLLQRSFSLAARKGRRQTHRHHHRSFHQRRAGGRSCKKFYPPYALHTQRTHASGASKIPGVDALSDDYLGTKDRPRHRSISKNYHRKPHSPRAGLPLLLRDLAAGETLPQRALRESLQASTQVWRSLLSLAQKYLKRGTRSCGRERVSSSAAAYISRKHPWQPLLSLKAVEKKKTTL